MYKNTFYRTISYILVCISSIALAGCYDADDNAAADAGGFLWLNLSKGETRAAIDSDGAGSFTEGDRVGLYIDNGTTTQYRELVYEAGNGFRACAGRSSVWEGLHCRRTTLSLPELRTLRLRGMGLMLRRIKAAPGMPSQIC